MTSAIEAPYGQSPDSPYELRIFVGGELFGCHRLRTDRSAWIGPTERILRLLGCEGDDFEYTAVPSSSDTTAFTWRAKGQTGDFEYIPVPCSASCRCCRFHWDAQGECIRLFHDRSLWINDQLVEPTFQELSSQIPRQLNEGDSIFATKVRRGPNRVQLTLARSA